MRSPKRATANRIIGQRLFLRQVRNSESLPDNFLPGYSEPRENDKKGQAAFVEDNFVIMGVDGNMLLFNSSRSCTFLPPPARLAPPPPHPPPKCPHAFSSNCVLCGGVSVADGFLKARLVHTGEPERMFVSVFQHLDRIRKQTINPSSMAVF